MRAVDVHSVFPPLVQRLLVVPSHAPSLSLIISHFQITVSHGVSPWQVVKHGACLGLGLAGMGAGNEHHYELVNRTMNSLDSAVTGESAGISIGLLLLGRLGEPIAETAITECLAYAHETKHEKVIRGIAMGVAMIAYGMEEAADALISQVWHVLPSSRFPFECGDPSFECQLLCVVLSAEGQ